MYKILDCFSGIGMFSHGFHCAGGFETVAFCEIESFPQKVLKKNFPGIPIYENIKTLTTEQLEADGIIHRDGDGWAGIEGILAGVPCQPASLAGKRKGTEDERWLWGDALRLVRELRPRFAVFENPPGLLTLQRGTAFGSILHSLAASGYDVEWQIVSAEMLGAPHIRERLFVFAYLASNGQSKRESGLSIGAQTAESLPGNDYQNASDFDGSRQLQPEGSVGHIGGWVDNGTSNAVHANGIGCPKVEKTESVCDRQWNDQAQKQGRYGRMRSVGRSTPNASEVADSDSKGLEKRKGVESHNGTQRQAVKRSCFRNMPEPSGFWRTNRIPEPLLRRVDDVSPRRLDRYRRQRIETLGNTIVKEVAVFVGQCVKAFLEEQDQNA